MKIHFEKIEEHFNLNSVIQARFCEVLEQRARCGFKNANAKQKIEAFHYVVEAFLVTFVYCR